MRVGPFWTSGEYRACYFAVRGNADEIIPIGAYLFSRAAAISKPPLLSGLASKDERCGGLQARLGGGRRTKAPISWTERRPASKNI